MVAAGAGVTLLPASAVPVEARQGSGIVVRPIEDPAPSRTVALAWRKTSPRNELYRRFAEDLAEPLTALIT